VESAGKLLYVNRAGAQLFGASAAHELENHVLVDLISRDSRLTIESLVRLAGECDGPTPLVEMQIDRLDGRTVDIEAAGVRCVLPGKQLGTQLVLRDITDRKDAEVRMRVTNEQLEQRVAERTAEAERRAGQLQALVSQLAQVEQQERRKLAQLLHDHLQQFLVAGKMQVSFILSRARGKDVLQAAEEADRLLKLSIDASRTLTVELCPPILYHSGLAAALAWLVSWKRERYGLKLEVVADQAADPDSESVRTLLFQSVRELLFNVVKHSGVKQARVTMQRTPDSQVRISVEDEGRGFDCARVNAPASGEFGLFSIRQRLELVGGTLTVRSGPGRGTRVDLLAPIHVPSPAPPSAISAEPS
jgi:PAS domain S-box-containing protein